MYYTKRVFKHLKNLTNCLMFDIQKLNIKMIRMSNVKLFDVQHSNDKSQNDLNVDTKLFDV